MRQQKNWDFLDVMDKNLLYLYSKAISKPNGKASYQSLFNVLVQVNDDERKKMLLAEQKCQTAFYLIWFVFRYVLKCETLEQAMVYANEETFRKYKLLHFVDKRCIYIGAYGINEVYLYKYKEGDLEIILEVLYNRYDFFEQIDCFLSRTQNTKRSTHNRCKKAELQYLKMMEKRPEYKDVVKNYYKRKKRQ